MSNLFKLPSEKGSALKGKNFLPWGADSLFEGRMSSNAGKQPGNYKSCLPCKKGEKSQVHPVPLNTRVTVESKEWKDSWRFFSRMYMTVVNSYIFIVEINASFI